MIEKVKGKVIKLGDNINTDVIYPGRYLPIIDAEEMALHALEGLDPDFPKKIQKGDIIVAGKNFGSGSSREQAPIAIKAAGIKCVIAPSFARIFFRNAINIGLPIVEFKEIDDINTQDELEIDFEKGIIANITTNKRCKINKMPDFLQEIISAEGLVNYARNKILKN